MAESTLAPACSLRDCWNDADIFDPATGEGWCFDCFPTVVERWEAVALNPTMRELLPALDDR